MSGEVKIGLQFLAEVASQALQPPAKIFHPMVSPDTPSNLHCWPPLTMKPTEDGQFNIIHCDAMLLFLEVIRTVEKWKALYISRWILNINMSLEQSQSVYLYLDNKSKKGLTKRAAL